MIISLILLVAALIAFILDTIGVSTRVNLTALGLALLTLAMIVGNRSV
jgi:hypothetical protein